MNPDVLLGGATLMMLVGIFNGTDCDVTAGMMLAVMSCAAMVGKENG